MTTTDSEGMAGRVCAAYPCNNSPDALDGLCSGCRSVEILIGRVNAAFEEFLEDRFPAPRSATGDRSVSPLYNDDNPVRRELFDASGDVAAALARMVRLVVGRPVIMFAGPWLNPREGWHGGFAVDGDYCLADL